MTPETALIQFQSWAQQERAGQDRLRAALERVDTAVREASDEELTRGCLEIETCLEDAHLRGRRREELCAVLGAHFGVSPRTLSIGSLLERAEREGLGPEPVRRSLGALREDLREAVGGVNRAARRLSAVAQYQRGLLADLLGVLGQPRPAEGEPDQRGRLVNAEA